jgi:hypothetical protein
VNSMHNSVIDRGKDPRRDLRQPVLFQVHFAIRTKELTCGRTFCPPQYSSVWVLPSTSGEERDGIVSSFSVLVPARLIYSRP